MTECTSPPDREVEWIVRWEFLKRSDGDEAFLSYRILARTAWLAHQQVKGAPAFGSCRVVRVEKEQGK